MKVIIPKALRAGDTIGVAAPAGAVDRRALRQGIHVLREFGFKVIMGEHLFARSSFFAGSHRGRVRDLNAMIRNPEVNGIICARGGYGAVYLIPDLDWRSLQRHPKVLMGASDVTVLLNWIHQRTGLVTFHGPMVAGNFSKGLDGVHFESLQNAVLRSGRAGHKASWAIDLERTNVIRKGKASGKLLGGCLSLLVSSLGTPYEIEMHGAILFLEDVNEAPYRIDRMLKQLEDAGKFKDVRGFVFGEMLNCIDPKNPQSTARQAIENFLGRFKVPIVLGLSSGHTRRPFVTLPIGARVTLDCRNTPALIIEEATSR